MPEVSIHFQDGFDDDDATVSLNETVVLEVEHLRTSKLLGLADTKSIELPAGVVDLEIKLPRRNITQRLRLDTQRVRHVGISVASQGLVVIRSEQAFGYA
jgi:hypothetical protein